MIKQNKLIFFIKSSQFNSQMPVCNQPTQSELFVKAFLKIVSKIDNKPLRIKNYKLGYEFYVLINKISIQRCLYRK